MRVVLGVVLALLITLPVQAFLSGGGTAPNSISDGFDVVIFNPSLQTGLDGTTSIPSETSIVRVSSNGGPVLMSANPQIADGKDGQSIIIKGHSSVDTIQFTDGSGLALKDGVSFTLGYRSMLMLIYDALDDIWIEVSRSNQ